MTMIEEVLREYDLIRDHLKSDFVHWCSSDTKFYSLNNFMQQVQKNPFSFYDFLLTSESFTWLSQAIQKHSFSRYLSSRVFPTFCLTVSFILLLFISVLLILLYFNAIDQKRWERFHKGLWMKQKNCRLAESNCRMDTQETRDTVPSPGYLHNVRRGFHYIFFTKVSIFFFFLVAMFLVILSVTSLPYMVLLYKSQAQFRCGGLETFDAYFFGSGDIKPNNGLIARDWKGSYTQLKQIQDLEFHLSFNKTFSIPEDFVLSPTNNSIQLNKTEANKTSTNVSFCPLCYKVVKDFFSENGLKNHMVTNGSVLKEKSRRMGLLYHYLTSITSYRHEGALRHTVTYNDWDNIVFKYEFSGPVGFVLKNVTKLFYDDLEAKFRFLSEIAPKSIFEKIREGFNPTSSIFLEGVYALNVGKDRILQIDSVIRKHYWKMRYVVHKVNKLMLILFILTLMLSIVSGGVGCFLFFHLISACRDSSNLSRIRRRFDKIIFLFIIIGCVTLFVSAVQFFLATLINDACRFSFTNLLHLGQWSDLPPKMFQSNQQNVTDMELILDTCLKTGETGDIAGIINVRGLVDNVRRLTENKIIESREEFSNKFKNFLDHEILKSFLYYSTNAHHFLVLPPLYYTGDHEEIVYTSLPRYSEDGINFVSFSKEIPNNLYLVPLANLAGGELTGLDVLYDHIYNRLSDTPISIYTVLEKLNSLPATNNIHNISFCTTYMDKQKACSLTSPNTLHIGFVMSDNYGCTSTARLFDKNLACASEIFYNISDSTWTSSLSLFTDKNVLMQVIRYAYLLAVHDYLLRTPLYLGESLPYKEKNDSYFDHLDIDDIERRNFFLFKYLKNSSCVMITKEDDLVPNYCQVGDLLNLWRKDLATYTKEVLDSAQTLKTSFTQFHLSVENVMTTLMEKAKSLLEKSNCQVLGTSADIIFKVSCSNLFTSSQTLTILYFIISILSFLSAFLTLCIHQIEN